VGKLSRRFDEQESAAKHNILAASVDDCTQTLVSMEDAAKLVSCHEESAEK